MILTREEQALHQQALTVSRRYLRDEYLIIGILREVYRTKLFKKLTYRSLFAFAIKELHLSPPVAYAFNTIARKSLTIPPLAAAIAEKKITVYEAGRMVSAITAENAEELLAFASSHTTRELERRLAEVNPKAAGRVKAKPIGNGMMKLELYVSVDDFEVLERVKDLLATSQKKHLDLAESYVALAKAHATKKDPIKKAERAENIRARRGSLTAAQKHEVTRRDGGQCTHLNPDGSRCDEKKWLHIHHIQPVSQGGSNDPSNLTTLCSFHHDLVHQLSLPLDGQVNWLREPLRAYG